MMSLVGTMLLSGFGSLQLGLNTTDGLLGLRDKIRDKVHPLSTFNPVQRCTTSAIV
jgi:hypothetical protein